MRERRITLPELGLFAGTRALIGLGAGLLLADKLRVDQRRAAGIAMVATGVLSTVPLGIMLFRR
jgi:hypothetical protein